MSRRRNSDACITGVLRCDRVYFLQVLEGPRGPVVATMPRIQRDLRHTRIHILEAAPLAHLDFPDWSMALVPETTVAIARLTNPDLVDIVPAAGSAAARSLRAAPRPPGGAATAPACAGRAETAAPGTSIPGNVLSSCSSRKIAPLATQARLSHFEFGKLCFQNY